MSCGVGCLLLKGAYLLHPGLWFALETLFMLSDAGGKGASGRKRQGL